MDRRKFILGVGGTAIGGSALIGSGAFSRVESQRDVTIEVAEDADAYLGLSGTGSPNSQNFLEDDGEGHVVINIADQPEGDGVNSDSRTWFDSVLQVCNQGKEGVGFYIQEQEDLADHEEGEDGTVDFYTGTASGSQSDSGIESLVGEDNVQDIPLGECIEVGVRTNTKGVDALDDSPLFDDDVTLIADVDIEEDLTEDEPIRNSRTGARHTSIQEAIDDADEGDTIEVLTDTEFEENVNIDVSGLTLEATSNSRPVINGRVDLFAEDVTFRGFEVDAENNEGGFGVLAWFDGITIEDSRVTNHVFGVFVTEEAEADIINNVVEEGDDNDFPPVGVFFAADSTGSLVDNRIADHFPPSEEFSSTNVTVDGADDLLIEDNEIEQSVIGIEVRGELLDDFSTGATATNTEITGNDISNHEFANGRGVMVRNGAENTTITENFITGNGEDGTGIGLSITGLTFEGPDPTGTDASRNDFVDNENLGLRNGRSDDDLENVDATESWWGDADGPDAGNGVSDSGGDVLTEPWSTESGPDWNDEGVSADSTTAAAAAEADDADEESPSPSLTPAALDD